MKKQLRKQENRKFRKKPRENGGSVERKKRKGGAEAQGERKERKIKRDGEGRNKAKIIKHDIPPLPSRAESFL